MTSSCPVPGTSDGRLRYRLLTGVDDRAFCERVSQALEEGYRLYGNPAVTVKGDQTIVAQAVVLDAPDDRERQ